MIQARRSQANIIIVKSKRQSERERPAKQQTHSLLWSLFSYWKNLHISSITCRECQDNNESLFSQALSLLLVIFFFVFLLVGPSKVVVIIGRGHCYSNDSKVKD